MMGSVDLWRECAMLGGEHCGLWAMCAEETLAAGTEWDPENACLCLLVLL